MAKKTLVLIGVLIVIVTILLYFALKPQDRIKQTAVVTPTKSQQLPTSIPGTTLLSFSPSILTVSTGSTYSAEIAIDSVDNMVTAVQLDLDYNPNVLTDVSVKDGNFFTSPQLFANEVENGNILYAAGTFSNGVKGKGTIATITFKVLPTLTAQTEIVFTPKTQVTAEKSLESVLKNKTNLTLQITTTRPQTSTNSATQ